MPPYVRAYHLILPTYGFWLPNDPRGSWSNFVRAWELFRFAGPATTTTNHRSLARVNHDWRKRLETKNKLARDPVVFTGQQALVIANGFAEYVRKSNCTIHACSIMPQHVHMVVPRHRYSIEQVANLLKGQATRELSEQGLHPLADQPYENGKIPSPWARKPWSKFLTYNHEIVRAIRYVEDNPLKEGKRRQRWAFVTPFGH